jgi:cytidylate kinase
MDLDQVRAELGERDARDAGRDHAPLKAADDAIAIDTTDLTPDQVLERLLAVVESRLKEQA